MRMRGSGAVTICFINSQGIPAFLSLGPTALRSLHLPCEHPGFSAGTHLCHVGRPGTQHGLLYSPPVTGCAGDGLCFSDAISALSLGSKGHSGYVVPEPGGAVSCQALIHWELTLPVQSRREPFEGCGLPGVLSAQVLSVLPWPSQRQHKSRKENFALWLLHQKYPRRLPGRLLAEGDAAVADGRGSTSLFRGRILSRVGIYVLSFMMLYRLRGINDFSRFPSCECRI